MLEFPNYFTVVSFCSVHSLALIQAQFGVRMVNRHVRATRNTVFQSTNAYQYGVYFEAMDIWT